MISARRHGETALVLHVLTEHHGRHAGLVLGGAGRRKRGTFQPGNGLSCRWRARLPEHLGNFSAELVRARAGPLLGNAPRLAGLGAACALVDAVLPEREPHPAVYHGLLALLDSLTDDEYPLEAWGAGYVRWELGVLAVLGFGLDLSACAATGSNKGLIWVSPKSGRAVSAAAGADYADRLLRLPPFLVGSGAATTAEISDGLRLTGHFMTRHGLVRDDAALPAARDRLSEIFR